MCMDAAASPALPFYLLAMYTSLVWCIAVSTDWQFAHSWKKARETTFDGGSLGSLIHEERNQCDLQNSVNQQIFEYKCHSWVLPGSISLWLSDIIHRRPRPAVLRHHGCPVAVSLDRQRDSLMLLGFPAIQWRRLKVGSVLRVQLGPLCCSPRGEALKLGRLIVLQKTHLRLWKILLPWKLTLFQSITHLISICWWFSAQKTFKNKASNPQISKWNTKGGQKSL